MCPGLPPKSYGLICGPCADSPANFVKISLVVLGCWFAGGDDLTGALHDLCSSSPVVTTTSIILRFNKHRLTRVLRENGR